MEENFEIKVPGWEKKGDSVFNLAMAKAEHDFYREGVNILKNRTKFP